MQVRRALRRVSGCANESDHIALAHRRAFFESRRVSIEMRVVVDKRF